MSGCICWWRWGEHEKSCCHPVCCSATSWLLDVAPSLLASELQPFRTDFTAGCDTLLREAVNLWPNQAGRMSAAGLDRVSGSVVDTNGFRRAAESQRASSKSEDGSRKFENVTVFRVCKADETFYGPNQWKRREMHYNIFINGRNQRYLKIYCVFEIRVAPISGRSRITNLLSIPIFKGCQANETFYDLNQSKRRACAKKCTKT